MSDKEKEILQAFREGREAAFAAIMREHYQSLYDYGRRFTRDEAIVKDCIQDIFINLWLSRSRADQILSLRQYLLTALKRRIIRVSTVGKRQVNIPGMQLAEYDFSADFSVEELIIKKQLADEKAQKLKQVLSQLTSRQKEVIYLLYYQQLDHEQVGELMNINRQSVYNLLHESIKRIRAFWQEK